jgi:putative phage-type endonuclease
MILADPKNREEWLQARTQGIGGSDAGCIVGANPWKSARQLWREKSGIDTPPDISDKPAVRFGKEAEQHLRALFLLDHPEYSCEYHEFRMYANDRLPWLYATLDGELTLTATGRRGIYEGKTTEIKRPEQWDDWNGCIPQHYYVQILHQMLACEWAEYVVLFACIRYTTKDGERRMMLREYTIERSCVSEDLAWLLDQEKTFWNKIEKGIEPPDLLPEI